VDSERWSVVRKHRRDIVKYLIVYEKSNTGWGAYAPDLPGLGAAGKTLDEVKELIREAVEFHLEGMRAHGDPIPAPRS
jgi:predicted RNase H-like HicB family nuclease